MFPSFNVATRLGQVQMSLSYSGRVERPTYSNLNANVSYLNRMTYESGNPRLLPTKLHSLEYMSVWKNYFAQVSYSYFDNPIVNTTKPYSEDGEMTILTYEPLWGDSLRLVFGSHGLMWVCLHNGSVFQWVVGIKA